MLDPAAYVRGVLQHDPWYTAERILRSVAHNSRTAVKACHASSKSFTAAEAALWWVTRYPDGLVVTTAPTWTQVERIMWSEIHKATARAQIIKYPPLLKTELKFSPSNYAIGISTDQGVRFQGWHGTVLIILDEAVGIRPDIWEAIEGIRAGGKVHILALANPTIAGGPFYDAYTTGRQFWKTFTINAFATPNLEGLLDPHLRRLDRELDDKEIAPAIERLLKLKPAELDNNVRPYLVSRRWVLEKYYEWGPGHPLWDARVLGRFPMQSEHALFWLSWLEQAKYRVVPDEEYTTLPLRAGLDVAGPGEDETTLFVRQGPKIIFRKYYSHPDPRGEVVADLGQFRGKLATVNVDTVGIGYYMARHLEDSGFPVQDVNVGLPPTEFDPTNKEKYFNLKAELYWALRLRAQEGALAGLDDETLIAQMTSIQYTHDPRGRIKIESKDDMRKRGVKSPDRAEGCMLAFAEIPRAEIFIGRP